jgi:signal transduction histidine kinase
VDSIVLRRDGARALVLQQLLPETPDETIDLRNARWPRMVYDSLRTIIVDGDRNIRVIGRPDEDSLDEVEITMRASPLKAALLSYGRRTLYISLILSAATAGILYLVARKLFAEPVRQMIANMAHFREDPEDIGRVIRPASSVREINAAERALENMQIDVRDALRQRARLAALGQAVAKISHDLRNMLASAQLMAERFESSRDPLVRRGGSKLIGSLDRAIKLCESTLRFGRAEEAAPEPRRIALAGMVREVGDTVFPSPGEEGGPVAFENRTPSDLVIEADPDQLFRVLVNLCRNARQAIEATGLGGVVRVDARALDGACEIDVIDDGPGMPTKALENLFQPFVGAARKDGSGLGLAIAQELTALQGGKLELVSTTTDGTVFRVTLPLAGQRVAAAQAEAAGV